MYIWFRTIQKDENFNALSNAFSPYSIRFVLFLGSKYIMNQQRDGAKNKYEKFHQLQQQNSSDSSRVSQYWYYYLRNIVLTWRRLSHASWGTAHRDLFKQRRSQLSKHDIWFDLHWMFPYSFLRARCHNKKEWIVQRRFNIMLFYCCLHHHMQPIYRWYVI